MAALTSSASTARRTAARSDVGSSATKVTGLSSPAVSRRPSTKPVVTSLASASTTPMVIDSDDVPPSSTPNTTASTTGPMNAVITADRFLILRRSSTWATSSQDGGADRSRRRIALTLPDLAAPCR